MTNDATDVALLPPDHVPTDDDISVLTILGVGITYGKGAVALGD